MVNGELGEIIFSKVVPKGHVTWFLSTKVMIFWFVFGVVLLAKTKSFRHLVFLLVYRLKNHFLQSRT